MKPFTIPILTKDGPSNLRDAYWCFGFFCGFPSMAEYDQSFLMKLLSSKWDC